MSRFEDANVSRFENANVSRFETANVSRFEDENARKIRKCKCDENMRIQMRGKYENANARIITRLSSSISHHCELCRMQTCTVKAQKKFRLYIYCKEFSKF